MSKGLTREQLEKLGAKPVPKATAKAVTREQLEAMGAKPIPSGNVLQSRIDLRTGRAPTIGAGEAALLGAVQPATLGFFDEAAAAGVSAANAGRSVQLGPEFRPSPDDTPEIRRLKEEAIATAIAGGNPLGYGEFRDRMRQHTAHAAEQQPEAYGRGEMGGALLTAFGPGMVGSGFLKAAPAARAARMMGAGATAGAATGAGGSEADLTTGDFAGAARDALTGGTLGLVGAGLGAGMARAAPRMLSDIGRNLEKRGIDNGRRVLQSGADSLSGRTVAPEAVREALRSKAITYGGTTESAAKALEGLTEAQANTYGEIIETLHHAGVKGPKARFLAQELAIKANALAPNTTNDGLVDLIRKTREQLTEKAQPDGTFTLPQSENLKRSLQKRARYGRVEETESNEKMRELAAFLRENIEDSVEKAAKKAAPDSDVRMAAESFVPVKQRLGRLIEARDAAERGLQKAQGRQNSALPGVIETTGALASANPLVLLAGPIRSLLKNRGPSIMSRAQFDSGRGANTLSMLLSRIPARTEYGAALGAAAARAYELEPPLTKEQRRLRDVMAALEEMQRQR